MAERVCVSIPWQGRPVRSLRPLVRADRALLEAVMRGEFAIQGFRNGDVRALLFGPPEAEADRRRQTAHITRRLRILRAHGLIEKIPKTHRYVLNPSGRTTSTAFLVALNADTQQLNKLAA